MVSEALIKSCIVDNYDALCLPANDSSLALNGLKLFGWLRLADCL